RRFLQVEPKLLVAHRAFKVSGVKKCPRKIANVEHATRSRNAVHMDVEDRQKNADTECTSGRKIGIVNFPDVRDRPVGRTYQGIGISRDRALRIAKKGDDEQPKDHYDDERSEEDRVQESGRQATNNCQDAEKKTKRNDFCPAGAGQTKSMGPLKRIGLTGKPIAAYIAEKLQVALVDDV